MTYFSRTSTARTETIEPVKSQRETIQGVESNQIMGVNLRNVSIRLPIFDTKARSFKRTILNAAVGGRLCAANNITYVEALRDITLSAETGDRIALMGHNGSGKTTLLRVIAGVYHPHQGQVEVTGKVTSLLDNMLGMDGDATGFENIKLRGFSLGLKPQEIGRFKEDIAEFSELGDFLHMPLRTYSSGMVLRLAFSICTCLEPEILLMDEWLSTGDQCFSRKAEARLLDFVDKAGILILASHDRELIERVCTRKIYLERGEIIQIEDIG
ncbi:MAG: ABC transporter ATP-binding protein [Methylomagnum sp.]